MPIAPAVLASEAAETIWQALKEKHPIPLFSISDLGSYSVA